MKGFETMWITILKKIARFVKGRARIVAPKSFSNPKFL